jgi:hypothetical protein
MISSSKSTKPATTVIQRVSMMKTIAALLLCVTAAIAQTPATVKIALAPHSNVPRAEVDRAIDARCSGAIIVADATSADYILDATDNGASAAHHYNFALSDHKRQVFLVETSEVARGITNGQRDC